MQKSVIRQALSEPIINIQEVHELSKKLPGSRGRVAMLDLKLPYQSFFMLFKEGGIIFSVHVYKLPDSLVVFTENGEDETARTFASIKAISEERKVTDLGFLVLPNKVEFGNHSKPKVMYQPPQVVPKDKWDQYRADILPKLGFVINAILFAIKLMQCKNIEYVDYDPNKGQPWRKKHGKRIPPFVKYKILQVNPIKQRQGEINRPTTELDCAQRMHTVRGHFKTFTTERPLFGRLTGTYWWGDCVKGNPAFGLLEKDYDIKIDIRDFAKQIV